MRWLVPVAVACGVAGAALGGTAPVPTGRRLRDLAADAFPEGGVFIGSASHGRLFGTETITVLDREFAYVTPSNDFKQSYVHATPGRWRWQLPDRWIEHCAQRGQVIRMHAPISPQCSAWVKDDSRTGEELETMLREYMTALCKRYNGKPGVKWLDVVNETVTSRGSWFGPKKGTTKWENPWPKIGFDEGHPLKPPLYIRYAFEIANEHAPEIKQIINQHGGMEDAAWDKVKATVKYLRELGLRVDGIGWQAHVDVGWEKAAGNLTKLRALIRWAHDNELEFHVTENNVFLRRGHEGEYDAQAATFAAIVRVLLEERGSGVVTWNLWNVRDNECMRKEFAACMFFVDYRPKPGYYALQALLEDPPAARRKR